MYLFRYFLLILSILFFHSTNAQTKKYLLALSKGEKKLFVYDYATLDTIKTIPVGPDPHEIVTDEDGSLAYISNPQLNAQGHEINVIDLKTLTLLKTIDTRPFYTPHGLVYKNGKLWLTAQGSKAVAIYNPQTDSIEQVFGTGQDFTHLLHVADDGKSFYTTNVESGTVSIYEQKELPPYMPPTGILPANARPRTEWRQTLIDVGYGAEGFDVSPDGKELWTAKPDGHIIIIDIERKKIKDNINTDVEGLHRLKFTPDGKTVCISSVKITDLLFYNAESRKLEKTLTIGWGAGIYIDKDWNRMFISCTMNNYVSFVDLGTRREIKRMSINRPDGVTSVTVK